MKSDNIPLTNMDRPFISVGLYRSSFKKDRIRIHPYLPMATEPINASSGHEISNQAKSGSSIFDFETISSVTPKKPMIIPKNFFQSNFSLKRR